MTPEEYRSRVSYWHEHMTDASMTIYALVVALVATQILSGLCMFPLARPEWAPSLAALCSKIMFGTLFVSFALAVALAIELICLRVDIRKRDAELSSLTRDRR